MKMTIVENKIKIENMDQSAVLAVMELLVKNNSLSTISSLQIAEKEVINIPAAEILKEVPMPELRAIEPQPAQMEMPIPELHVDETRPKRKKLIFDTCTNCGSKFCQVVQMDDAGIAPVVECRCGYKQPALDIRKGTYECKCGTAAYFWATPRINTVLCKDCKSEFALVVDGETSEYVGYPVEE